MTRAAFLLTAVLCAITKPLSAQEREPILHYEFVRSLPARALNPPATHPRTRELLTTYYQSLVDWGRIVRSRVEPVPDRPGQLYVGLTRPVENDIRPTAYAAMVLSFLAECDPPEPLLTLADREAMREEAIGLIRYLTASHIANDGKCVNGQPWGNAWQSAMWTRALGMAAWQSWSSLNVELQQQIANVIAVEADRFIDQPPKSSIRNDTGAEENAWNAAIVSLACNMMPEHPHAKVWEQAAKRYMYNTFSVRADAENSTAGDDGRPIREWVSTVNAHDDFTVENHGLVHVGYLKNSAAMLQENSIHWSLAGRDAPRACQHHMPEVFAILSRCMNWNAAAIYFGGNDWRIYETQNTDIMLYSVLRQETGNPAAGYLEDVAIGHLVKRQTAEGGYYNARRDLEFGGMCATRMIACFYSHAMSDQFVEPATEEQFNAAANGVVHLKSAKAVLHRTPDKFASFTWAQQRMALAIPSSESSVVWPHFTAYLGVINNERPAESQAKLSDLQVETNEDGFAVQGRLLRCNGSLIQDFYYASPAGPYTVYAERLRPLENFKLLTRYSGSIGLEYAVGSDERTLYGDFGQTIVRGLASDVTKTPLSSTWLNISNRIGYVVKRGQQSSNTMYHHDRNVLDGRKPHLQESIILISDETPKIDPAGEWSCIVTFMNQSAEETKASTRNVNFTADGNSAKCVVDGRVFEFGSSAE